MVCGLSPTRSALLIAPVAIASGVLAPIVGTFIDRTHPVPLLGFGFSALAISLTWISIELNPATPIWRLVLPFIVLGVANAFIWSPLAATATRNLPHEQAGAGSGAYNATRQLGAVLGSAGMAAFMTSRIGAELPGSGGAAHPTGDEGLQLPEFLRGPFAAAMSQSMLLPAFIALFGVVASLFLVGAAQGWRRGAGDDRRGFGAGDDTGEPEFDPGLDDDAYVEYVLCREPDPEPRPTAVRPAPPIETRRSVVEPRRPVEPRLSGEPRHPGEPRRVGPGHIEPRQPGEPWRAAPAAGPGLVCPAAAPARAAGRCAATGAVPARRNGSTTPARGPRGVLARHWPDTPSPRASTPGTHPARAGRPGWREGSGSAVRSARSRPRTALG